MMQQRRITLAAMMIAMNPLVWIKGTASPSSYIVLLTAPTDATRKDKLLNISL